MRYVGLSNGIAPHGVAEFVAAAEAHGLPRVATVQNPYALTSRALDSGLDEVITGSGVAARLLAAGLRRAHRQVRRGGPAWQRAARAMAMFETMKRQRWGRPEALEAAKFTTRWRRKHGLTPTQLALAFCYTNWRVASTIIGVTSTAQLDGTSLPGGTTLSPELLAEIDAIRAGSTATRLQ